MNLNRIGVVDQIFSVPTEKGKKVLTDGCQRKAGGAASG